MIAWLHRQPQGNFLPQPFEQLAGVLRDTGRDKEAQEVMIQENRDHRDYFNKSIRALFASGAMVLVGAFVFSLETFVPLVTLDQNANWAPNANAGRRLTPWPGRVTTGSLVRAYLYAHILAGWVLTTLWVSVVTGLVKS